MSVKADICYKSASLGVIQSANAIKVVTIGGHNSRDNIGSWPPDG